MEQSMPIHTEQGPLGMLKATYSTPNPAIPGGVCFCGVLLCLALDCVAIVAAGRYGPVPVTQTPIDSDSLALSS